MAVIALAAVPGTARGAVPFLSVLGRGHDVVSWHRATSTAHPTGSGAGSTGSGQTPAVDAIVAATVDALDGLPGLPTAVWVTSLADLKMASASGVEVPLTTADALVDHGAVLVPRLGVDLSRYPVVPPLVRARMRLGLDLPSRLVVAVDHSANRSEVTTTLALAAAAVVTGPLLPLALALGTPVVTSPRAAARFGLRAGVEVEVAEAPSDADRMAAVLAGDESHTAALSRRGRHFAEHHLDLGHPARLVRVRLGLDPVSSGTDSRSLIDARLAELATPSSARVRRRVDTALASFPRLLEKPA